MSRTWSEVVQKGLQKSEEPTKPAIPETLDGCYEDDDKPCVQCEDNAHFRRVGWRVHAMEWHEKAVQEANEHAKIWADSDEGNCSLSWTDLWLHHFQVRYQSAYQKLREKAMSDYEDECYKKSYRGTICSYHAEGHWFS